MVLKIAGIYCVLCKFSEVHVGKTGRSIKTRCKEHMRRIHMGQPQKSTMAEQRFDTGHNINFKSIYMLDKATGYMDCVIKEATEFRLYPKNFNKGSGFTLSQSSYLVSNILKQYRTKSIQKQG